MNLGQAAIVTIIVLFGAHHHGDEYQVEIPRTLTLKNSIFKDEGGKRSVRLHAPDSFIPAEYYAKAVHHTYHDGDWKTAWDFGGRQSFYGKFDYASEHK